MRKEVNLQLPLDIESLYVQFSKFYPHVSQNEQVSLYKPPHFVSKMTSICPLSRDLSSVPAADITNVTINI